MGRKQERDPALSALAKTAYELVQVEAERDRLREAITEHIDTIMPRDGSTVDEAVVVLSAERLYAALSPESGR